MSGRAALEALMMLYLDALAADDPGRLPLADGFDYVENNQRIALGDGLWGTIDAIGAYRHFYCDPENGRVGFIGAARENGVPVILDAVMEVQDGRIAWIETFIVRDPIGGARLDALGEPEPVWLETVPPEERLPREGLIALANRYFESMQRCDGKGDYSFFDPGCDRYEHGLKTTNVQTDQTYGHSSDSDFPKMTAEDQWKTGFLGFVTEIRERRFPVVDVERQAVLAQAMFDHDGSIRSIDLTTGTVFELAPYFDVPRTLQIVEGFRARDGKILRVEATMSETPYGARAVRAEA